LWIDFLYQTSTLIPLKTILIPKLNWPHFFLIKNLLVSKSTILFPWWASVQLINCLVSNSPVSNCPYTVVLGRSFKKLPRATELLTLCSGLVSLSDSKIAHRQLGLGRFGFTATTSRVQTIAMKRECQQTEQNKKDYESCKRVRSFIPSWQIEYPGLVDIDNAASRMCFCRIIAIF